MKSKFRFPIHLHHSRSHNPPAAAAPRRASETRSGTTDFLPDYEPWPAPASSSSPSPPTTAPVHLRRSITHPSRDDVPLLQKDTIFVYQMAHCGGGAGGDKAAPQLLDAGALLAAGLCGSARDAQAVHAALQRAGVLTADPARPVDTDRIGAGLARQVRVLPPAALRALVKVLFFWEEEAVRLRLLAAEEDELKAVLAGWVARRDDATRDGSGAGGDDGDGGGAGVEGDEEGGEKERVDKMIAEVELRIRAVRMKMGLRPSERLIEEQLPRYRGAEEVGGDNDLST